MRDRSIRSGVQPPHTPEDEAEGIEDPPKRTRDGRFASPHSGNPRGRPPKPKADIASLLQSILEEDPRGAFPPPKTIAETLMRQTLAHGMKQPRIALELLKLCLSESLLGREDPEPEANDEQREAILADYVERKSRFA